MGLRSFVALPINKSGLVTRLVIDEVPTTDNDRLSINLAYGVDSTQAVFLAVPYRLSSGSNNRLGDVSLLYRKNFWQDIDSIDSARIGFLLGGVVPTDSDRDPRASIGLVATRIDNRHEWDADILWQQGIDDALNTLRYDLSWQYRVYPKEYPEWGLSSVVNTVVEFAGRGVEGETVVQQLTVGFQWVVTPRWVLESGVTQDLNGPDDTNYLISTRFHF